MPNSLDCRSLTKLRSTKLRACLALCGFSLLNPHRIFSAEPDQPTNSVIASSVALESQLAKTLKDLQSPLFAVRTESLNQLHQLAFQAPELLEKEAENVSYEVQIRILRGLESIFLMQAGELSDRAELAIERMSLSDQLVANQAQFILFSNSSLRETRGRKALERLGVKFYYCNAMQSMTIRNAPDLDPGDSTHLQVILISEDWTGELSDLWNLRRFEHYEKLIIYNVRGNGLQMDDLVPLTKSLPRAEVQERGGALGIQHNPAFPNIVVSQVVPDSPASRAGLRPADRILNLNDRPIASFTELVKMLTEYAPGEVVTLNIIRSGSTMPLPVTLGSWKEMKVISGSVEAPWDFGGPLGQSRPSPPAAPELIRTGMPQLRLE